MNKDVYEKTRYQNIKRHKKNKNYVIVISKPKKTSISRINNEKIYDIEQAIKIRNNIISKATRVDIQASKEDFKTLWDKYIYDCQNIQKLAFSTVRKKIKLYNKYLSEFNSRKVSSITKVDIIEFIKSLGTTDKQKNEILRCISTFLNWCVEHDYIANSPSKKIKSIKVNKSEMKYWLPEEFTKFINYLDKVNTNGAKTVKLLTIITFSLGDRIGETRALTWDCFDKEKYLVSIKHSINYDYKSNNFFSSTKNSQSQRDIDISPILFKYLEEYKEYLINTYGELNDMIFFNYKTNKPYTDTYLRKEFKKYAKECGVPVIRMYDLRHTFVATMMSEGWELYHISQRIGHKNYSTTVDKYGHLSNKVRKEIAQTTDKYMV